MSGGRPSAWGGRGRRCPVSPLWFDELHEFPFTYGDGGPLAPTIPLGEGSGFRRWLRPRIHLLETPQEPLLQVTVDAADPTDPSLRCEAVPITPSAP